MESIKCASDEGLCLVKEEQRYAFGTRMLLPVSYVNRGKILATFEAYVNKNNYTPFVE